jgi:hypothetical protein
MIPKKQKKIVVKILLEVCTLYYHPDYYEKNRKIHKQRAVEKLIKTVFYFFIFSSSLTIPNLEIFQKNKSHISESGNIDKSHNSEFSMMCAGSAGN